MTYQSAQTQKNHRAAIASCAIVGALLALPFLGAAPVLAGSKQIPDKLKVPPGNVLLLQADGRGTQKYTCPVSATSNATPHAILRVGRHEGDLVAIHFGGPTWQALDGSSVVGDGAKAIHFTAPDPDGVDWLLLPAKSTTGNGEFSRVTSFNGSLRTEANLLRRGASQARPRYWSSILRSTCSMFLQRAKGERLRGPCTRSPC
jgi:hypothetical protein